MTGTGHALTPPHMADIPGGEIVLRDEAARTDRPATLVRPFRMSTCPVTRELYLAVRGEAAPGAVADPGTAAAPGAVADPAVPATEVSWLDAVRFCDLLSLATGRTPCYGIADDRDRDALGVVCDRQADGYRLPTEAEWEHACRAGSREVRYGELDEIAWYRGNAHGRIHEVGTKEPNAWGLYDTIGNVWEWCWDVYDPEVYGPYRVFRGGGWQDPPRGCRASCRRKSHPTFRIDDLGFRLALPA